VNKPDQRHLPATLEEAHELIGDLLGEMRQMQQQLDWLRRKLFGRSSERMAQGELEFFGQPFAPDKSNDNSPPADPEQNTAADAPAGDKPRRAARRSRLDDLPRQVIVHDVAEADKHCACGREKTRIGQDDSEQLEFIPASVFVLQHVRPKYACPACHDGVVQAPMPAMPIERGAVGPGLLAHLIVSKYADHLPLNRQESILARHGIDLPRSLSCEWVMKSAELLEPVVAAMRREILAGALINTDDTPIDVHTPQGQHQARLWTYVGDPLHPHTVYDFTWDRSGAGPRKFLAGFAGTLQADAFSGYDALFRADPQNPETIVLTEAGCMAHARRKFYDARAEDPLIALPILALVRELYGVEREARERWPALTLARPDPHELAAAVAGRLALRQEKSAPLMETLQARLLALKGELLPKSGLGGAVGYGLGHWEALSCFLRDGLVAIDNNAAERAIRPLCLGRRNWLHLGSRRGGRAAATLFSLIQSARRHGIEPFVYLRDLLTRIPTHLHKRIDELFPDNWLKLREQAAAPEQAAAHEEPAGN
jgi:transposase